MGFSRHIVERALKEMGDETIRPEMIVTWLLDHPEVAVGSFCMFRIISFYIGPLYTVDH